MLACVCVQAEGAHCVYVCAVPPVKTFAPLLPRLNSCMSRIVNRCRYPVQVAINGWRYMPNCHIWTYSYSCPFGSQKTAPVPPTPGCGTASSAGECARRTEGWWLIGGAVASSSLYGACPRATASTQPFATQVGRQLSWRRC